MKAEAWIHVRVWAVTPCEHWNPGSIERANQLGVKRIERNYFGCNINRQGTPVIAKQLRDVNKERVVSSKSTVGDLSFLIENNKSGHLPCIVPSEALE